MSMISMAGDDFAQYENLECYLFDVVSPRFQRERKLTTFDFFCIVIWKANRAKSKIARKLLNHPPGHADLDAAVAALVTEIVSAANDRERLAVLIEGWGFRLPMASAILTVLYPENFSVYDVRVCDTLGNFHTVADSGNFDKLWLGYQRFLSAVKASAPQHLSLRDKDRWLWGKSFATQLQADIESAFGVFPNGNRGQPTISNRGQPTI